MKILCILLFRYEEEGAAHKEAFECIYDLHERHETSGSTRMHFKGICCYKSASWTKGNILGILLLPIQTNYASRIHENTLNLSRVNYQYKYKEKHITGSSAETGAGTVTSTTSDTCDDDVDLDSSPSTTL